MPTTARRSAWGLDTDHGPDWRLSAPCGRWPDMFTADAIGSLRRAWHARAVHICRRHCPVLAWCADLAAQYPPVGGVQAGVAYRAQRSNPHGVPRDTQPADPGCGQWCESLGGGRA